MFQLIYSSTEWLVIFLRIVVGHSLCMLYNERQAYYITMFVCLPAAVNSETWCERHYIGGHPSFKTVNSLLSLILTRCSDKSIIIIIIIIIMYLSAPEFVVVTDNQRTSNF